ncbi:LCP family protein required for cell wall assembly [Deinococcus sp. HSC-46F16]|uniref:LCP family protein n=1 Tax=Deinococcus sp. HSC-46F16 TaxID=2910968 RepID=UPI00209F2EDF|nr:LCP family protein [Deinococcus sp. HSC-46F16]MCP2014426.1 LCP family protein required for cell wall assembly [Deinococcus sp. HSC-46F16]
MRRRWLIGTVLLALAAGGGGYLYLTHERVSAVGQVVYHELDGDGLPPPAGVLDDPVFADLPPPDPDRPVSLGRYLPPEPEAQAAPEPDPPPAPPARTAAPEPVPPPAREEAPVPPAPSPAPEPAPAPKAKPEPTPVPQQPEPAAPPAPAPEPSSAPVPAPRSSPASAPAAQVAPAPRPAPAPRAQTPATSPASPPVAPRWFNDRLETTARLHLLLIGTDHEELGGGRGDVLLVLTLDPVERQLTLLSVPRDTRVNLPGHGLVKINAAYAYGGARLQTEAIERFLGLPMDKYVEISLGGFRRAIDEVGGVTVNPPFAFTLDGQSFTPGPVRLSGEQALAYARMRKQDPRGDLGRNARQQEVVRRLMAELGERSTGELQALLERLQGDLRTNFSPTEVVRLRTRHSYLTERQRTEAVRGVNRKIGGVWYYVVSDAERRRLHLELR